MARGIDFFNTVDVLEPRCKQCETILEYGVNTAYDDSKKTHVCNKCGTEVD